MYKLTCIYSLQFLLTFFSKITIISLFHACRVRYSTQALTHLSQGPFYERLIIGRSRQFPCGSFANIVSGDDSLIENATLNQIVRRQCRDNILFHSKKLKKENSFFLSKFGNCVLFVGGVFVGGVQPVWFYQVSFCRYLSILL